MVFVQVRLWRLHKMKKTKPEEEKRIEQLEEQWDLEDIILFRSLAEVLVRREKKAQADAKAKAGWFGGWFGGGAAAPGRKKLLLRFCSLLIAIRFVRLECGGDSFH